MDANEDAPPPYTPDERRTATFAQVAHRIQDSTGGDSAFQDALAAFGTFLACQENVTLSRNQLKVLKCQCILVLEEMAESFRNGRDISEILAEVIKIFASISLDLESKVQWATLFANPSELKSLETKISEAVLGLDAQLYTLLQRDELASHIYRDELFKALQKDREKIHELEAIIKEMHYSIDNLDACVQRLMEDSLRILGDRSVQQQQAHAKRSLAIIAELTGKSLPPAALLGREFVTVGTHAIHQGSSYDVFLGEYFTGERVVIKVLRQRLDEKTARKTHERFARQATNWSSLRHDAILPFYGIGVAPDPLSQGDYQLYIVSPYLQNQDARQYLKKYDDVSLVARFQMVLDIARGLDYMHEGANTFGSGGAIVHSSLDIFNVLIKDSGRAVISGFGHSKVVRDIQEFESFTGDNTEYRYMILTDIPPFGEKAKASKIIQLVSTGSRPKRADYPKIEQYACRDDIWNLFEECWNTDPIERPSAEQIAGYLKSMLSQIIKKPKATSQPKTAVSSQMPVEEIVKCLKTHHCLDITSKLDVSECSSQPVAGGGFADVHQGRLQDGRKVAIKRPRLFVQNDQDGRDMIKFAAREMYSASKLIHPNVIRVTGLVLFRDSLAIISPWMENGVVTKYLASNPKADRCKLCHDICGGLAYMHGKNIVHGDLKGANVLVSGDGVAKISDFGNTILKQYTLAFTGPNDLQGLSMRWTPHELLTDETVSTKPTRAADVYALGMETMTGKVPFHEKPERAVYGAIREKKLPSRPEESIPVGNQDGDKLWQLITDCWAFEPTKRPAATKVVSTVCTNAVPSINEDLSVFLKMGKITQQGLTKKPNMSALAAVSVGGDALSAATDATVGPTAAMAKTMKLPGGWIQSDTQEPSRSSSAPVTSHAALTELNKLQAHLSQLGPGDFQTELSVLESLRQKLSNLSSK
ncbi:hypothetical protein FRC09_011546 [Ceratobasidium sp. 395]|nr:hypothetical protein FRC09_011546 [Ceratobasidium sp. 395]